MWRQTVCSQVPRIFSLTGHSSTGWPASESFPCKKKVRHEVGSDSLRLDLWLCCDSEQINLWDDQECDTVREVQRALWSAKGGFPCWIGGSKRCNTLYSRKAACDGWHFLSYCHHVNLGQQRRERSLSSPAGYLGHFHVDVLWICWGLHEWVCLALLNCLSGVTFPHNKTDSFEIYIIQILFIIWERKE